MMDVDYSLWPGGFVRKLRSVASVMGLAFMAVLLAGCNLLDPASTSIEKRSGEDKIFQGNIALQGGNFSRARELFDELYQKGETSSEVVRGLGEATAGLAGFTVVSILDALQNGASGYDKGFIAFRTVKLIRDRKQLEKAIGILMQNRDMLRPDYLSRGLMRIPTAAKILLEKFDLNRNGKLDVNDNIQFDMNDKTVGTWPDIFRDLITGPSSAGSTLEQAYSDLVYGFDGRGTSWTFFSPVNAAQLTGTYSFANKMTILSVGDFAERIKTANLYYNVNLASFAAAIREIDGAE